MKTILKYSVIILTYNEEAFIEKNIRLIKEINKDAEIIIADGGSRDRTINIAYEENIFVKSCRTGRGIQCNEGAEEASGEIFLFLHGDTLLPKNAFNILNKFFANEEVKIGTFRLAFDSNHPALNFYTKFTRWDSLFTKFGDSCIVIRRSFFNELGGFPNWSLLEDVELLRSARRRTKIYTFPSSVITSSRRFIQKGIIKQQLLSGYLLLRYLLGISPEKLAADYNSKREEDLKLYSIKYFGLTKAEDLKLKKIKE